MKIFKIVEQEYLVNSITFEMKGKPIITKMKYETIKDAIVNWTDEESFYVHSLDETVDRVSNGDGFWLCDNLIFFDDLDDAESCEELSFFTFTEITDDEIRNNCKVK